jgi:rsbT antagonist protein RsbS
MKHSKFATTDAIPIIQLWGNLLVPLQGDVTDSQAERLRGELLRRIRESDVSGLVIDASGVSVIDSHLCGLLARLAAAAELMGVRSVLCGLSPDVVMTLQAMAIDLGEVETALSLETALDRLGVRHPQAHSPDLPSELARHNQPDPARRRAGNNQE